MLPSLLGDEWERWCWTVRQEYYDSVACAVERMDTVALLDVFITGWDTVFCKLFNTKDPRNIAFEVRRARNKWAHQAILSSREAYRALDAIYQLLVSLEGTEKCLLRDEIFEVNERIEDVVLSMARSIYHKRQHRNPLAGDADGDVAMRDADE